MKTNIVYVRFSNGCEYPYLNDRFELAVGDKVYVDGKLAGVLGEVTEVLTRFKVSLKYYKYVLQKVDFDIKGEFKKTDNFMVTSGDSVLSFERMFAWLKGPKATDKENDEEPEEFISGDGYELDVNWFCDDEAEDNTVGDIGYWDGQDLVEDGCLKFLTIINGKGKALIQTSKSIKTVEFDFDAETMKLSNVFCDCIIARFCEDIAAVAYAIEDVFTQLEISDKMNITLIENKLFNKVTYGKSTTVII